MMSVGKTIGTWLSSETLTGNILPYTVRLIYLLSIPFDMRKSAGRFFFCVLRRTGFHGLTNPGRVFTFILEKNEECNQI